MKTIKCKLTVYFAEPFWVGVFERICDGKLSVAKVTFGAEPKDYDIQEFVLKSFILNWPSILLAEPLIFVHTI